MTSTWECLPLLCSLGGSRTSPRPLLLSASNATCLAEMALVWMGFVGVQLARQGVRDCSLLYWLLSAVQIPIALAATAAAMLRHQQQRNASTSTSPSLSARMPSSSKAATMSPPILSDPTPADSASSPFLPAQSLPPTAQPQSPALLSHWCDFDALSAFPNNDLIFALSALVAGWMGGLLGIGGGMVMGPVLLELNVPPQVSSATSSFIVVFSSSLSVLEFHLLGRIPFAPAMFFFLIAMIAAVSGLSLVRAYIVRSGRVSIIIFALATVIGASGVVLGGVGGQRVYVDWQSGVPMGFRNLCGPTW
eukprot:TRINITY_DN36193_c0_g4_i1.p1 TRINITY_DN36193_c0_g4~~TRINITY_DN36193_c0_g4_i1.p1  ORF type:complete len:354 (+),score=25.80 TRINITY_DN36193_c0_g4_i1:147-1064(+)